MRLTHRAPAACLLLAAVLAWPAGAGAQFRPGYRPSSMYGFAQTQAAGALTARNQYGYGYGFRYAPYAAGYGYGPYANYYQTPMNGFLTGAADVMTASGQYEISHQQANLTHQQVKSASIDNRRKMFDELRYEKENTPPLSANLAADFQEQVRQARLNPTDPEIWDGKVLNILLQNIRNIQAGTGLQGAEIPLDPDTVKHISLSVGKSSGSSTMLNNGGKLKWPPELDDERFDPMRKEIDKLFLQATQEAGTSEGLSGRTMRALTKSIDGLKEAVDGAINDMTPSDNIRASAYCNQVASTAKLLRDPNVAKQLNGDWAAKGNSVGELIANMTKNGQQFGPAGPADKPYYSSLYQSMLAYDSSLMQLAGGAVSSPGMKP